MELDIEMFNKYLENKVTPEEKKKVLAWLSTEEGQAALAHSWDKDVKALAEGTASTWSEYSIPSARMKKRFMGKISAVRKRNIWVSVAAVGIPFFMLLWGILFLSLRFGVFTKSEYASVDVPCGEQMMIVLQDGTEVHLNSSSSLRYPRKMGLFSREVRLSGEAYFRVAKDRQRPFIVDLNGVDVRVTGTEFNAKAYPDELYVQVMLNEGGVLLENDFYKYTLEPGECACYDRETGFCEVRRVEDETTITGWRSHSLNFYRVPLGEILKTIGRQYDVTFEVEDKALLDVRFIISISKAQVKDILEEMELVSDIYFTAKDNDGTAFIVSSKKK